MTKFEVGKIYSVASKRHNNIDVMEIRITNRTNTTISYEDIADDELRLRLPNSKSFLPRTTKIRTGSVGERIIVNGKPTLYTNSTKIFTVKEGVERA